MMKIATCVAVLAISLALTQARPQPQPRPQSRAPGAYQDEKYPPMPYDFDWKVEDAEYKNYYGQNEVGTAAGRVDGSYYVWLPDGRLMTVTYYVDGESGFVPTITYSQNANPFGKR
ncbi:hypothetical protein C0J52_21293 [Blattella germanica]|nr:hypothetical protein C0J52_21293 [Blattella germanica]